MTTMSMMRTAAALMVVLACHAQAQYLTPLAAGTQQTLTGYVADRFCVDARIAVDKADMLLAPWNHTVGCMTKLPQCVASGYCLLQGVANSMGVTEYYCVYNFTTTERDQLKAYYEGLGTTTVPESRLVGTWSAAGVYELNTIDGVVVPSAGAALSLVSAIVLAGLASMVAAL